MSSEKSSSSFQQLTDEVSTSPEVFLDTSIHCSLHKGKSYTNRIDDTLARFKWKGTSSYTKTEYGNVVLSKAEYYLRTIKKLKTLEATLDWVANRLRDNIHKHHRTWAFNLLTLRMQGKTEEERTERAKLSLQQLLLIGVSYVDDLCDSPINNGTECFWASQKVTKSRSGDYKWKSPTCKRSKVRCRLHAFFDENVETFRKIQAAIELIPERERSPQLAQFRETIAEALVDSEMLLDYRKGCVRIADAIIAVDGKEFASMFTMNITESELLCEVLGQTLIYLPNKSESGVLIKEPRQRGSR